MDTFKAFPMSPKNGTCFYRDSQAQIHGKKINVNGRDIALFHYRNTLYAMDEKCPHLGMYAIKVMEIPGP